MTFADLTAEQRESLRGPAGQNGTNGQDGHSPQVTASKSNGVTTVYVDGTAIATINDGVDGNDGQNGTDGTNGSDGTNGTDGITPTVSVSTSGKTHTV
jgi:hypothetical protein